ncbi:MAG: hypothetical protein MZV65_39710 [Chromatiales bacterium]|nr:hypothetical protein [Chromatiales bacterium]MCK7581163.1 hypothetical protein [Chromatiales bacterium]
MREVSRATLSVGDEIAGVRVIEIMARGRMTPIPARLLAYRVACARCGHERIIRHISMLVRISRGLSGCSSCKTSKAA